MGIFSKKPGIDWDSKPIHDSIHAAVDSDDLAPYKVKGVIERCSPVAEYNYGQFTLILDGDNCRLESSLTGGTGTWVGLSCPGDQVVLLIEPYVVQNHFLASNAPFDYIIKDFINLSLEERFGKLRFAESSNEFSDRKWLGTGGSC